MMIIGGLYNEAVVFTDLIENEAEEQIELLMDQPFAADSIVRIMPDVHAGKGCTIGTTMTVSDKVCPNLVGVDIGCGVLAVKLIDKQIDFSWLDIVIRKYIPSGFSVHDKPLAEFDSLNDLICRDACNLGRARASIGTLGGGNHYIEVDKDSKGSLWLVIHTGSRHLGTEVCGYYQKAAIRQVRENYINERDELIASLKSTGRDSEIESALKRFESEHKPVPDALCYLEGGLLEDYLHDMVITQNFARLNRRIIAFTIMYHMGLIESESFESIHNYIDTESMILRKGAVSAKKGEKLIIPMNMRDGALICSGKGNSYWNCSAPHGAGRLMSRSEAKRRLSLSKFSDDMNGIWTSCVSGETIDECPDAYKPADVIMECIRDTVDVVDIIKPVYNFKA